MPQLKSYFKENRKRLAEIFLGLLLLFQFSGFVSVFSEHIDPRSLLSSRDADASHVVGTANKTRWYKDNGESAYGAFFYRTIHTFGSIAGRDFNNPDSKVENHERAHHLAVMVLSLLSVFGISYLLSRLIFNELWQHLLFTASLTGLLLSNPVWATFVFRAHPDMMFAFFVLAAFLATNRAVKEGENSVWFKLSALLWGASGMIKLSFVLFLPVMWLLWMPPFNKQRAMVALKFYLWMLPSYLLLGFPQSFNIPRSLKFLAYQSQFSIPPTSESFFAWLSHLKTQGLWPLVAILVLAPFATEKTRPSLRVLPLILFPLFMLLRQNSEYQTDYYLFPVLAIALAWMALAVKGRLPTKKYIQSTSLAGVAAGVFFSVGLEPKSMEAELQKTLNCRPESQTIYRSIHKLVDEGRIFAIDPYTPYDRTRAGDRAKASWENSWDRIREIGATALAVNTSYAIRFASGEAPSAAVQSYAPGWQTIRTYYQSLLGQEKVEDPNGGTWTKVERACDWEIWLKQ